MSWDLSTFGESRATDHFQIDNFDFYSRLCSSFTKLDLPDSASNFTDYNLVVCERDTQRCYPAISQNSFKFKPIQNLKLSEGVLYTGYGEPYAKEDGTYVFWEVSHEIKCSHNPEENSTAKPSIFSVGQLNRLIVEYRTKAGCATEVSNTPTPTPAYSPRACEFERRNPKENTTGINADLANINGGPYGIRTEIIIDNKTQYLFYQPCERMKCPYKGACEEEYSSAWICELNHTNCISYGTLSEWSNIRLVNDQTLNSLELIHQNWDNFKRVETRLECNQAYPDGHIQFFPTGELSNEKSVLIVRSSTPETCTRDIPQPVEPSDNTCHFITSRENYFINISLKDYNKPNGWAKVVESTFGPQQSFQLLYQPCGPMPCPFNTECNGDIDATVWLCDKEIHNCVGYGLFENNLTASLYDDYIMNGLKIVYYGDQKRKVIVQMECNKSLDVDELVLPDTIDIDYQTVHFIVRSKQACAYGDGPAPSPPPFLHIPIPTPGLTPTPTPNYNPDPVKYIRNLTHFIKFELDKLEQETFRGTLIMYMNHPYQLHGSFYTEYSPWNLLGCPNNWDCSTFNMSNIWGCWDTDDGTKYCHPVGDARIGLDIEPYLPNILDFGVFLTYHGANNMNARMLVNCDMFGSKNGIPLHSSFATYTLEMESEKINYYTSSSLVCPHKFLVPFIPSPHPTPTLPPDPVVNYKYKSKSINGKHIEIDLNELESIKDWVMLGYGIKYELVQLHYSPVEQIECPDDYNCQGMDKTNVWKCFRSENHSNLCFSVGDARYNINYNLIDENDLSKGVSVNYEGGYGGYEIHINLRCNKNVRSKSYIDLRDIGTQYPSKVIIVDADAPLVCPIDTIPVYKIAGGTYFTLLVMFIAISYLVVGVLVHFIRTHIIELPHHKFWIEFVLCLETGIDFVISCGKIRDNYHEYDISI